jgi:16S rRNA (cytidine1402-2'-O)-methyltransferase
MNASAPPGRLVLIPNALDLGSGHEIDLRLLLPQGAIERAAGLRHWVVENAKSARGFLKRVQALAPLACALQEMHIQELPRPAKGRADASPAAAWQTLLQAALQGHDIGLLSEAGLPAVADPGSELVAQAHALGIPVEPWPGPSSLMMALSASGLGGQHFAFVGYLPVEPAARSARIRELEGLSRRIGQTQIAIETPYRNAALLQALVQTLQPATRLAVATGLSLPGGWVRSLPVARWRELNVDFDGKLPAVFAWAAASG